MKIKTAADSIDPQLKRRGVEVKKEKTDQTVFGSNWNLLLPEKASSHWLNDILLHNFDQNNTRVHTGNIRVSIRMLLVCCPYVFVCYSFVTRMYPGGVSVRKDRKSLKENQGEKRQSTHYLLFLPFLRGWRMILTRNNESKLSLSGGSQRRTTAIKELMSSTFPIRRREVLTQNVRVWKMMEDFPNFASSSGNEVQYCYNE